MSLEYALITNTSDPTADPTEVPTNNPSGAPTNSPTQAPSDHPIRTPTHSPSNTPTNAPESDSLGSLISVLDSPTPKPTNDGGVSMMTTAMQTTLANKSTESPDQTISIGLVASISVLGFLCVALAVIIYRLLFW